MAVSRDAWNKAWRAANLQRRAARQIGPHQYVIEGHGRDPHGQPNVWHVDLGITPPECDCPAFIRGDAQCKHIIYFQFVEAMLTRAAAAP